MIFKIIAVGKIKNKALADGVETFLKRLSPYAKTEIEEIRDGTPESEGKKILDALSREKGFVIILSEEGEEFSSIQFSQKISVLNCKIIMVIGGPYGLIPEVKKCGDMLLALSKMTFTHEMARFFLTEQLYRSVMIAKGKKYHN